MDDLDNHTFIRFRQGSRLHFRSVFCPLKSAKLELTRLNIDADDWKETPQRLLGPNKKIGSYSGGTDRLTEVAKQRGCEFVKNIAGRNVPLNSPSAG